MAAYLLAFMYQPERYREQAHSYCYQRRLKKLRNATNYCYKIT